MRMENVLRPDAISCAPTDTLLAVAQRMRKHHVSALAVLDGSQLTALICGQDLVLAMAQGIDPRHALVQQHSTPVRETASPSEDTRQVVHRMLENGLEHIAVLHDGAVVNVVSVRHLVAVEQWPAPQRFTTNEAGSVAARELAFRPLQELSTQHRDLQRESLRGIARVMAGERGDLRQSVGDGAH